jgi:hypothetical protein
MTARYPIVPVLLIALWLPAVYTLSSLTGCVADAPGLPRAITPQAYSIATNTVTILGQSAAQVLPPPFSLAIQGFAAAVLALLAAWQGYTHRKLEHFVGPPPSKIPVQKL